MTDLAQLERRLQRIEDERAIERLIASYGPSWMRDKPTPRRICGPKTAVTTSRGGTWPAVTRSRRWCAPTPTRD